MPKSGKVDRHILRVSLMAAALGCLGAGRIHAQPAPEPGAPPAGKLTIPEPKDIKLVTSDGVILQCRYYPGGVVKSSPEADAKLIRKDGHEVVPIILLHGYGERGSVYDNFATALQSVGHAVLVPDLRGHGGSVATVMNLRLDHTAMKGAAFANMYRDVDAAKKFLFAENNEGRLNIELLTVLGADLGAVVATNWAGRDWSWPQLPAYKQGRDVKCLILLSPTLNFNGYRAALKHPIFRAPLPLVMVAVGTRDSEALEQAEGIYKILERSRAAAPNTIKLVKADTELQGADLLTFRNLRVDHQAALFIFENIAKNVPSFPWRERRSPLDVGDDDAP